MTKKVFLDTNKYNMFWSLLLTVVLCLVCLKVNSQDGYFEYSHLPDLPPNIGQNTVQGLAGPYTGVDDEVLIVAGGAISLINCHGKLVSRLIMTGFLYLRVKPTAYFNGNYYHLAKEGQGPFR